VKKPTDIGMNRTGIKASPVDSKKTIEGAQQSKLVDPGDATALADERIEWSNAAEPVGTMPPPGSVKGVLKTVMEKLKGNEPNVFLDKIGERIAFERTGVRLYDALLCKLSAAHLHEGGPTREEVEQIREEELQHFMLLTETMESLGGDPTAMTPCADITAVASSGILKVLADPRTTLTQCLDAILSFPQQIFARSKCQTIRWASFDARRFQTDTHAVHAERAFRHFSRRGIQFGNIERAARDAVTASNAVV